MRLARFMAVTSRRSTGCEHGPGSAPPGKFSVPVKIGYKGYGRIGSWWNAKFWLPVDPTDHAMCVAFAGLTDNAPWAAVYDKLLDMERPDIAEAYRSAQGAPVSST